MRQSDFVFKNPYLTKSKFEVNESFDPPDGDGSIDMPISTKVRPEHNLEDDCARVGVEVTIGSKKQNSPFIVQVAYQAEFEWEHGKFTNDQLEILLNKNAAALLLSYIRPAIATITNFSCFPAYNLPYLDLTKNK